MRAFVIAAACAVTIVGSSPRVEAQKAKPAASAPAAHILLTPDAIKWGPAPAALPNGAQVAILNGDPSKPGFFVVRLKFPDGYKVPAHWHPTDENLTVLQGTFRAGMGDAFSDAGLHDFAVGSYIKMPKHVNHFATANGETIVQLEGQGPFVVNYVNPKDDPRGKTAK